MKAARVGRVALVRGNRGMGESIAHSEHYFALVYLAKPEGNAHSGLLGEEGERRRQRAFRVFGHGTPGDEGNAHWECYFAGRHQR